MRNAHQETVVAGVEIACSILSEYAQPGPRDAEATIQRLLTILDDKDFVVALERLKKRRIIRLVG